MSTIKIFSERIKLLRGQRASAVIARELDLSPQCYLNYEKGIREPPYDVLIRIAKLHHVSIDFLLGVSNEPKIESTTSRMSVCEILTRLIDADVDALQKRITLVNELKNAKTQQKN